MSETAGLGSYDLGNTFGFLAPLRTPPAVLELLYGAALQVLQNPEFAQKMAEQGMTATIGNSRPAMSAAMRKDVEVLGGLVKATGIEPE